jgi:hypothetical protein
MTFDQDCHKSNKVSSLSLDLEDTSQSALTKTAATRVPRAFVEALKDEPTNKKSKVLQGLITETMDTLNEIVRLNPLVRDQVAEFMRSTSNVGSLFDEPVKVADFAAAMSDGEPVELQEVLEGMPFSFMPLQFKTSSWKCGRTFAQESFTSQEGENECGTSALDQRGHGKNGWR